MSTTTTAVQNLAAMLPLPYMNVNDRRDSVQKTFTRIVESVDNDPPPKYDVPQPRVAFSAFVDHPEEFIKFLEACVRAESLAENEKGDIYTTLFEMYLRNANDKPQQKDEWESKARGLVEGRDVSNEVMEFMAFLIEHQASDRCVECSLVVTSSAFP